MFVIPSYYDGSISNVHDTIQSIQKFHPGEKIVVCDADSPIKNYTENYKDKNVIFFDAKNKRRPVGALLETYKEFPNEENYILIHDWVVYMIFCVFLLDHVLYLKIYILFLLY